jgi:hypothetical protein
MKPGEEAWDSAQVKIESDIQNTREYSYRVFLASSSYDTKRFHSYEYNNNDKTLIYLSDK